MVTPEEKSRAQQMVTRSGVAFAQAIQVLRGELTLNAVLNEMWLREKRDRLVKEGLDSSLAGQVVRGHLELDRARRIQSLWQMQGGSFHSDALKAKAGGHLLAGFFGSESRTGEVLQISRYDLTIRFRDDPEPTVLKKHELKFHSSAEHAEQVRAALGTDPAVAALAMGASANLEDRFRPTEELALSWATRKQTIRFTFRDGETIVGVPMRVALYEIEILCGSDARVCVLTHALLKDAPFEVLESP
jgi:hypothetical protein